MKKLLLITLMAVAAISCKKEEVTPKPVVTVCTMMAKRQVKTIKTINYVVVNETMWADANIPLEFYSNNCSDEGKIIERTTQFVGGAGNQTAYYYRDVIVKK